jgi:3'-phosphoadenosine 5'-phosphosulfate sulfotransferase (PAPS reductase)/FAD synthetase
VKRIPVLELFAEPTPDPGPFSAFDWIVINSSGGKDSQATLETVCARAESEGVLSRVVVVHADLGWMEWQGTREIAEAQARRWGVRFEVVDRAQGDLLTHIEAHGKFPDKKRRYCTSDHKTHQVYRIFTQITDETRADRGLSRYLRKGERPVRILNCLGMRAEESPDRSRMVALEADKPASNGKREVVRWLPIHRWSVGDVWRCIDAGRTSDLRHYAYSLGMSRVSCCFCILSSRRDLEIAARHNPELLKEYQRVEARIGHKFRQDLSMAEIGKG